MMVDDLLRATLRDLADEAGPTTDMAGRARATGRRLRRRRRVTATVSAALVLTATAFIPYAKTHRDPAPPSVTTIPSPRVVPAPIFSADRPFHVPGDLVVTSISGRAGAQIEVLDLPTSRYRPLPSSYTEAVPSPDRRWVAGEQVGRSGLTVQDTVTGNTWSISYDADPRPQWSTGVERLLIFRDSGFTVFQPAAGGPTDHDIPEDQRACLDFCQYTWLADGTEVALPQAVQRNSDPSQVTGLAIFDARTGDLLRNLPVLGAPLGAGSWSPDGGTVLIRPAGESSANGKSKQVLIARTTDGHPIGGLRADLAFFLPDGTIFGRYGAVVTHYDAAGHPLESMTLPAPLATKTLTFAHL